MSANSRENRNSEYSEAAEKYLREELRPVKRNL